MVGTRLLSLVLLSALALGAKPAVATNDKTFPGANCLPRGDNIAFTRVEGIVISDAEFSTPWTCPIARDIMRANSLEYANIILFRPSGAQISCTFLSRNAEFSDVTRVDSGPPVNVGENRVMLEFARGRSIIPSAHQGVYSIICNVSQGVGFLSYRIEENE